MQIVHVPDNPATINPDIWWITDGVEARTLRTRRTGNGSS